MAPRTISAKEIVNDVRAGLTDAALMEKHQVSEIALKAIFKKLLNSGALKLEDLKNRKAVIEKKASAAWKCPACGMPQLHPFDECPECGIIVSKLKGTGIQSPANVDDQIPDHIGQKPSFLKAHRAEVLLVICGILLMGIVGGGFWLKADAERRRQVEAERTERIEKDQRLKAEAEARAKEAQLQIEELRTQREIERSKKQGQDRVETKPTPPKEKHPGSDVADKLENLYKRRDLEARLENMLRKRIGLLQELGRHEEASKIQQLLDLGKIQEAAALAQQSGR